MIKKILLGLAGFVVLILVFILLLAAFKPPEYRVERSHAYAAPASELFGWFANPKKFNSFNPWVKMDPHARLAYEGPESGVGAVSRWDGEKIGAGRATITEIKPNELIRLRMDWEKPMKGASTVDYTFREENGMTTVTWAMYGKQEYFMCKVMSVFMNCESICGPEFEKGLADLEKLLARSAQP